MINTGDTTGQIEPLLSSFDEPVPLTAIPTNSLLLNRLDEEEVLIEDDDTDLDTDADSRHRREQEDEDAKIPLLNAEPEVKFIDWKHLFLLSLMLLLLLLFFVVGNM